MENKTSEIGLNFLSYLNDTGEVVSGYFDIIDFQATYIKIQTKGNIVIIPMQRVLKIKLKGAEHG